MFVVLVRFSIEPGAERRFLDRVRQQAADSLAQEPACRRFDVCVDAQDAGRVLLYGCTTARTRSTNTGERHIFSRSIWKAADGCVQDRRALVVGRGVERINAAMPAEARRALRRASR